MSRAQLLRAGMTPREIQRALERGELLPVHRGVYRVGHQAPNFQATYMAAVLACGPGALLSGAAAAYLLGLTKGKPPPPEVITPGRRRVPGIKTRRVAHPHRTIWYGIPVTSPTQTIVDRAPHLPLDELALMFHEADVRHHTRPEQIEAIVDRRPNTPGAPKLRLILIGDVPLTLSRLESGFLGMLREDGLELPPETNRRAGGHYVDCRWPRRHLTIELDSYKYRRTRHAWEHDRRRERDARARGDDFRRYTWSDVFERREAALRELRPLLGPAKVGLSKTGR